MKREDRIKLQLTESIIHELSLREWNQRKAAEELNLTSRMVSFIFNFKFNNYSIIRLIEILGKLDYEVEVKAIKI